jgi:Fe-S cluster assembly protein SufD
VYYGGTIYVAPHAHTTQARQSNKNMLLDSRARATSVPSLEVLTKQVQCAHGSAVGNLDQDALWYMLSRGVALQDARRMLLEGFVAEIIDPVPADVLEQIKKTVV